MDKMDLLPCTVSMFASLCGMFTKQAAKCHVIPCKPGPLWLISGLDVRFCLAQVADSDDSSNCQDEQQYGQRAKSRFKLERTKVQLGCIDFKAACVSSRPNQRRPWGVIGYGKIMKLQMQRIWKFSDQERSQRLVGSLAGTPLDMGWICSLWFTFQAGMQKRRFGMICMVKS